MMLILAQNEPDVGPVIAWSIGLLLVLVIGMAWALRLKRRMKRDDEPLPAAGFTLSDLRQMHRSGQITDAEFARARDKIVAAAQQPAERDALAAASNVPGAPPPQRDSAEAIRARRRARGAQQQQTQPPAEDDELELTDEDPAPDDDDNADPRDGFGRV